MAKMFKRGMSLFLALVLIMGQLVLPVTAETETPETPAEESVFQAPGTDEGSQVVDGIEVTTEIVISPVETNEDTGAQSQVVTETGSTPPPATPAPETPASVQQSATYSETTTTTVTPDTTKPEGATVEGEMPEGVPEEEVLGTLTTEEIKGNSTSSVITETETKSGKVETTFGQDPVIEENLEFTYGDLTDDKDYVDPNPDGPQALGDAVLTEDSDESLDADDKDWETTDGTDLPTPSENIPAEPDGEPSNPTDVDVSINKSQGTDEGSITVSEDDKVSIVIETPEKVFQENITNTRVEINPDTTGLGVPSDKIPSGNTEFVKIKIGGAEILLNTGFSRDDKWLVGGTYSASNIHIDAVKEVDEETEEERITGDVKIKVKISGNPDSSVVPSWVVKEGNSYYATYTITEEMFQDMGIKDKVEDITFDPKQSVNADDETYDNVVIVAKTIETYRDEQKVTYSLVDGDPNTQTFTYTLTKEDVVPEEYWDKAEAVYGDPNDPTKITGWKVVMDAKEYTGETTFVNQELNEEESYMNVTTVTSIADPRTAENGGLEHMFANIPDNNIPGTYTVADPDNANVSYQKVVTLDEEGNTVITYKKITYQEGEIQQIPNADGTFGISVDLEASDWTATLEDWEKAEEGTQTRTTYDYAQPDTTAFQNLEGAEYNGYTVTSVDTSAAVQQEVLADGTPGRYYQVIVIKGVDADGKEYTETKTIYGTQTTTTYTTVIDADKTVYRYKKVDYVTTDTLNFTNVKSESKQVYTAQAQTEQFSDTTTVYYEAKDKTDDAPLTFEYQGTVYPVQDKTPTSTTVTYDDVVSAGMTLTSKVENSNNYNGDVTIEVKSGILVGKYAVVKSGDTVLGKYYLGDTSNSNIFTDAVKSAAGIKDTVAVKNTKTGTTTYTFKDMVLPNGVDFTVVLTDLDVLAKNNRITVNTGNASKVAEKALSEGEDVELTVKMSYSADAPEMQTYSKTERSDTSYSYKDVTQTKEQTSNQQFMEITSVRAYKEGNASTFEVNGTVTRSSVTETKDEVNTQTVWSRLRSKFVPNPTEATSEPSEETTTAPSDPTTTPTTAPTDPTEGGGEEPGGGEDIPAPMNLDFDDEPAFLVIEEEPTPLAPEAAPAIVVRPAKNDNGLATIEDELVPLADAPETGDPTLIFGATGILSMAAYAFLGKKKEEEEA